MAGEALSAKLSAALSAPPVGDAVGLNVRVTVQDEPPATWLNVEHVVEVIVKSPAFVPVMPGLLVKVREAVPVFMRVTIMEALVVPSGT